MEESFWGAVQLMLFIYALAAVVSLTMAWVIRLIFSGIKSNKVRRDARDARNAAADGKD